MNLSTLNTVACLGGGPAGLYSAILLKLAKPSLAVHVLERNRADDTFGWGVVLSDQTVDNLRIADPVSAESIASAMHHWDDIVVHHKGEAIRTTGHGFAGIGRKTLLAILQARAEALGVDVHFSSEVDDVEAVQALYAPDLLIACDGLNSKVRTRFAETFAPNIDLRTCRFAWLGTRQQFDAFTFAFVHTEHGWWQAHAYQFEPETSTFIVETPEAVWQAHGVDKMSQEEAIGFCERLFADYLGGHPLMSNARHLRGSANWIRFPRVICGQWVHEHQGLPIVLMGDAAHTAHFSIGSGTKLALEDAIDLVGHLQREASVGAALDKYQAIRSVEVLKIQNAARNSTEWFENIARYADLPLPQFTYSLLSRSQRIGHENLRLRDHAWLGEFEAWYGEKKILPMVTPYRLRDCVLMNRVVVSPMATYHAVDGVAQAFHQVHYGARALGGAGLVMVEMTSPTAEGRITPACLGLWTDEQEAELKKLVDFVHAESKAKIGLQIGHSGPKGSTQIGWAEIDEPLSTGNWPVLAASSQAYGPQNQVPVSMNEADMAAMISAFAASAKRAHAAGFDLLELHAAHGYLLASFLSPLTNQRDDSYGGSLENRARFPLAVFCAMREVWPAHKPTSVRLSAHDWAAGGNTADDAVAIAKLFKAAGVDLIDVSSGQTTRAQQPVYGRMYQTPFADRIRNEVGIATMAVGAITEADQVNSILAAGRADLCALGRPHLANPNWTLHELAKLGKREAHWPLAYTAGRDQLYRELAKQHMMKEDHGS